MMVELKQIDDEIEDIEVDINDVDKAAFEVPSTDEGYLDILKERFGHSSFLPGQLDAIKILTAKRDNALVVLATGGGKSLIYQYVSQFMQGLILVVSPLIALMQD
jgi:superfamily II DNA helicase RecQ